jgi:hypothetical protein
MKKIILRFIVNILPLLIGVFLIYYSYSNTSLENRQEIFKALKYADYRYVFLSLFLAFLSHVFRAYRWNYLLAPIGHKINLLNSSMYVFVGYLSNLGVPRSGELLRATSIALYDKVPFEKGFGTIITERMVDVIILAICIFIGMSINSYILIPEFSIKPFLILIILSIVFYLFIKLVIKNSPLGYKISTFILGLKKGILSIFSNPKKEKFIIHTLFIWILYFLMIYVVKFSMPETILLGFEAIFSAFVAGSIAIVITNGGIGIYPLAIASIISKYEVSYEIALAFGWVVWTSQTLMIIMFGALSFIFLPFLNKKNNNSI